MLGEPIRANDIRIKYFSGLYPWEIEADLNEWFEKADENTLVLDIDLHFTLEADGSSGPIWTLLTYTEQKKS